MSYSAAEKPIERQPLPLTLHVYRALLTVATPLAGIDIVILRKFVPFGEQPVELLADRRIGPRHVIELRIGFWNLEEGGARPAAHEQAEERVHD